MSVVVGGFLQVTSSSYLLALFCTIVVSLQEISADARRDSRIYIVAGNYEQFTALDRYHRAFDADDMEANAIYALRTTLVRELLHTRQELKYFIGGKKRAQRLTNDKNFTFEFFHATCELYVENCYPNIAPDLISRDKGPVTYVKSPLYDIHQTIDDIYSTEVDFDPQIRKRLILGLIQLSVMLTRLDRFIKFYQRDIWQHKKRLPLGECSDTPNQDYLLFQDNGRANCLAKLQGKAQKIVEFLQFYRATIIDNYHLLIAPFRYHSSQPKALYQHIYKELERVGFPASTKQLTLTNNFHELPLPKHFEKEQNLANILLQEEKKIFQAIAPRINELIDTALINALEANSRMLENLGKEIHYVVGNAKFLKTLTCDHRLWEKTHRDFAYLEATIDFLKIKKKFLADTCQPKKQLLEKIANVAYWLNLGLLSLELFPSKIISNENNQWRTWWENDKKPNRRKWRKLALTAPLFVAGGLKIASEFRKWRGNKPHATYLSDNFLGNFYDRHSEQELLESLEAGEVKLNSDLGLSIILGIIDSAVALNYLGFHPIERLKNVYKMFKDIKSNRTTIRYLVTGDAFRSKHPYIDRGLQLLSQTPPLTRQRIDAVYKRFNKLAKGVFPGIPNTLLGKYREGYGQYLRNALPASLIHLAFMEGYLHDWNWDDAKRNFDGISIDFLSSIFFGIFVPWATYGVSKTYLQGLFPIFSKPSIFKKAFVGPRPEIFVMSLHERVKLFIGQSLKFAGIASVGMVVSQSALKKVQHVQGKESQSWEDIFKLAAYGTLYMAILTNIRVNFLRRLEEVLSHRLSHMIVHHANSAFGQWMWIVYKEKYKDMVNIDGKTAAPADELFLVKEGVSKPTNSQLFDFIDSKKIELPSRVLNNF